MNKAKTLNPDWIKSSLENLGNLSYYHKRKLIGLGYLKTVEIRTSERGRPSKEYHLTEDGLKLTGV